MAQLEVQPGSNITVTVNKGPLSGGTPAGNIGAVQFNKDGSRFGNVAPIQYDEANATVTLGTVGTVVLAGGTVGDVATNLGDGVIGWNALDTISNNTSAITINEANIQVSVANQPFIATITSNDLTFRGNILPEANVTYDLGSPTQRWRDIYLSNATIDMNGVRMSSDGESIVSSGGIISGGSIIAREIFGNISGDFLRGDGSEIFNINGSNVIGSVGVAITSGTADTVREAAQPNITSLGTLVELSANGPVDLGTVANLTVTGGTNGQYLKTNGAGDLSFATVSLSNINSGTTKVEVVSNSANIVVSGNAAAEFGTSTIQLHKNVTMDANLSVAGNLSNVITATVGNLNTTGLSANGLINLRNIANISIEGGEIGQFMRTDSIGGLSWSDVPKLENGSTTVDATSNNWVRFQIAGISDAFIVKEDGLQLIEYANSDLGDRVRANSFTGNLQAGAITLQTPANLTIGGGFNGQALTTNGNGNLAWSTVSSVTGGNSISGGSSYVTIFGDGIVAVGVDGTANTVVFEKTKTTVNTELTVAGNLNVQGNVTYIDSTTVNINDKNITLANNATTAAQANGGGITINGANAQITYQSSTDTWNFNKALVANVIGSATSVAVANVVGIGNIATVNLNANANTFLNGNGIFANIVLPTYGNVANLNLDGSNSTVLFGNGVFANLPTPTSLNANIANVVIRGGSNQQVLSTDGNGVLTWTTPATTTVGNIATINLDGNVSNVLSGTGTWVKLPVVGNIANLNLDGNSEHFLNGSGNWRAITQVANANYASYAGQLTTPNGSVIINSGTPAYLANAAAPTYSDFVTAGSVQVGNPTLSNNSWITNTGTDTIRIQNQILYNAMFAACGGANSIVPTIWANASGWANVRFDSSSSYLFSVCESNGGTNISGTWTFPLAVGGNMVAATPSSVTVTANANTWTFQEDGNLKLPTNQFSVKYANGTSVVLGSSGNVGALNLDGNSSHVLYGNGVFSNILFAENSNVANIANSVAGANVSGVVANAQYANIAGVANSVAAANITGTISFATNSNVANVANSIAGANVTGVVANANYSAYSNVANVANAIAGSNVTGVVANAQYANIAGVANSVALANVAGIGNIANINLDGNTGTVLSGNGAWVAAYSNSNVANYLPNYSGSVGNLTITGNLDVQGNVTYLESNTVNINDVNITLANNATTATQANGGGITINGANANIVYLSASNVWSFSHTVTGNRANFANVAANAVLLNNSTPDVGANSMLITDNTGATVWASLDRGLY